MLISRRKMLLGTIAGFSLPRSSTASNPKHTLRPAPMSVRWGRKSNRMSGFLGFNGSVPGPELRYRQGDQLDVRLENGMEDGALVHWHGVRVPNQMDGVSILSQEVVPPGGHYDYKFALPDAGTFWYHSHYMSYEQVGRGLFGPLVVEEHDPPVVDHDIIAMLADFRTSADGMLDTDFSALDDFGREGRLGNMTRVFLSRNSVQKGDRVRLRLVNAAIDRVFRLDLGGIAGAIVAIDGMPLETPTQLQPLILAPAQRIDIIGIAETEISFNLRNRNSQASVASISLEGQNPSPDRSPIPALPKHNLRKPGRISQSLELLMRGGEGDRNHSGHSSWAFNGVSGLPNRPFGKFRRGETARLILLNPTDFSHGIHMHGHHFREITDNGTLGPLRDTLLVASGETREIVCVFDNPGRWLLHCHMLSHSADGMATWVEVS